MPLSDIEQLLWRSMGLDSASVGTSTVERAVYERLRYCGLPTVDAYWEHLRDSASELQELIEAVVVQETWFFRDEESFGALGRLVVEILRDRLTDVLRFLSVPCSTGEEPYSMAMALRDAGLPNRQMTIDAVDISARALAYARRGIYGRNSFRSQNLAFKERYFHPVSEGYAVADWMSEVVTFHQGNLVSGQFPFPITPYDVIYCRNLLIYFDRSTQERVMQTLHSLLAPAGILFVGHAEAFLAASSGFTAVSAASFAFRKSPAKTPKTTGQAMRRTQVHKQSVPAVLPRIKLDTPRALEPVQTALLNLAAAQRLADQGKLQEAGRCCERILSQQGPSADIYHLLGVVRDADGKRDLAAECYRRAVYLDPNHVEALTHLALLSDIEGDSTAAQRLRVRAQRAGARPVHKKVVAP